MVLSGGSTSERATTQVEMEAAVDRNADVPAMGGESESGDDETTGQTAAPQDERRQATSTKAEVVRGETDEGEKREKRRARTGLEMGGNGPDTPETDDESGSNDKPRAGTRTTTTRGRVYKLTNLQSMLTT